MNMNKYLDKIITEAKKVSLTQSEKRSILSTVNSYIKENPIRGASGKIVSPYNKVTNRNPVILIKSDWLALFKISKLNQRKLLPAFIIIMLVLSGATTSFAANSALPGDSLYPIKVNVNEKVKVLLAVGTSANAKVAVSIAGERLKEVEKLAVKGKISPETKKEIKKNFIENATKVKTLVADLEAKGEATDAATINSEFESSLDAHNSILSEISNKDGENKEKVDEINSEVGAYLKDSVEVRTGQENKVITSPEAEVKASADDSLKSATNKVADVETYIENKKDLSDEVKLKATDQLKVAKDLIVSGQTKLEAGSSGEAYVTLQKASRKAKDLKLVLDSSSELNLKVDNVLSKNDSPKIEDGQDPKDNNDNIDGTKNNLIPEDNLEKTDNNEIKSDDSTKTESVIDLKANTKIDAKPSVNNIIKTNTSVKSTTKVGL